MANISISIQGIDEAIENLNYRPNSVKSKAIRAIRAFYGSGDTLDTLDTIDTDALIQSIWDVGANPAKIKSKRRNFTSIRSSINADLEKLSKKGANPENITISDRNIFDMTEEAKNNLLSSFTDAVNTGDLNIDQAAGLLSAISEFLDDYQQENRDDENADIVEQFKKILKKLTTDIFSDEEIDEDEDVEAIELDEDEELEEIELHEDEEIEEAPEDDDLEEIELDEDEEIEEIDEDEDVEEIELDEDEELEEIELDEDEEIEEVPEDDDLEEIELDEDEEIEEIDEDEDVEEIELDEDEELEEIELDEDEEIEEVPEDDDLEEIELDEDEEIEEIDEDEDVEEIELDEDEELEEIELDEDEEIEEAPEDDDLEEIELDEDEEIEEIDEDEDVEEIALEEDEELEEIELDEDEEIEEVSEDDDLEEVDLDEDEEIDEIDEDEIEELDEDEILEEVDGLTQDELQALEEYRKEKELAEHFDQSLGEREKKFNKYITVPAGLYTIGTKKSLKSSLELQQFEMPKVYIGVYPVTNALFEIFIEQTGYVTTAEKIGSGRVYHARFRKENGASRWGKSAGSADVKGACWHQPSGPGSSLHGKRNHPVVQVSVEDANAYASWIGRRLPTEAEWESAARTDLGHKYPWGNTFNPEALNLEETGLSDTCEVDRFDAFANEFRISDMLGNVMEWTDDMEFPSVSSPRKTKYCVAKGAAWNSPQEVTISSRALFKPGFSANTIGFRCISEISL